MNDFFRMPLLVVAFVQPGCQHCEGFTPRFRAVAERYYGRVPAAVFNALYFSRDNYKYLGEIGVEMTPAVIVFRYGRPVTQPVGNISTPEIEALFKGLAGG